MARKTLFMGTTDSGRVCGSYVRNAAGDFIETDRGERFRVSHESVREFTGVLDCNGLEVFEGDVVGKSEDNPVGVVKWHPDGYFYIDRHFGEEDDEAAECEFRVLGAEFAIKSGEGLHVLEVSKF